MSFFEILRIGKIDVRAIGRGVRGQKTTLVDTLELFSPLLAKFGFGRIWTLMQEPQIWPKIHICAKFLGIWVIRTGFMTIFDPILAYFWVRKWSFLRASVPATREILDIFGRDENHQKW